MVIRQEAALPPDRAVSNEASASAVSWAAILIGAVGAAAVSLLLVALGAGLGFASLSPWRNEGPSAATFTVMSAIWLILVQWLASGLGGYLTGRLRTKWAGIHTHEVFFRDTAHGFAAWAVATVITAILLAAAAGAAVGGAGKVASSVASGTAQAVGAGMSANGYEIDSLFRSTSPQPVGADVREEVLRILAKGLREGDVDRADRAYVADLIAARTGISSQEAMQRLDKTVTQMKAAEVKARQVADAARKSASVASFMTALSMLIGAFIASVAGALGGAGRDD